MIIQLSDFEKHKIAIENMTTEDTHEKVTLDLHVGDAYKKPGNNNHYLIPGNLTLKPNDTYVIKTREVFHIPSNVFGIVFPRASFSAEGLAVANLKVDPNYGGNLFITIFNTSKNRIKINKNEAICCIVFQVLEKAIPESAHRHPPTNRIINYNRYVDWILLNLPLIITFILSIVASIIASKIYDSLK